MFYQRPTVLNKDAHRHLRFSAVNDFGFTRKVNSVPLLAIEFFESSRDLPAKVSRRSTAICFARKKKYLEPFSRTARKRYFLNLTHPQI